jgi:hypothetical protein
MSNHYHLVVRIDAERAAGWDTRELLERWTRLFTGPLLVRRYLSAARSQVDEAELAAVEVLADDYRARAMRRVMATTASESPGFCARFIRATCYGE